MFIHNIPRHVSVERLVLTLRFYLSSFAFFRRLRPRMNWAVENENNLEICCLLVRSGAPAIGSCWFVSAVSFISERYLLLVDFCFIPYTNTTLSMWRQAKRWNYYGLVWFETLWGRSESGGSGAFSVSRSKAINGNFMTTKAKKATWSSVTQYSVDVSRS